MSLLSDIWSSFQQLSMPVRLWISAWLVPVNVATLFFLGERNGVVICLLAILGMAFNLPIMVKARGMTDLMALPHLILWTPLVLLVGVTLFADIGSGYRLFLIVLLLTDVVSLVFDARDFNAWRARQAAAPS